MTVDVITALQDQLIHHQTILVTQPPRNTAPLMWNDPPNILFIKMFVIKNLCIVCYYSIQCLFLMSIHTHCH